MSWGTDIIYVEKGREKKGPQGYFRLAVAEEVAKFFKQNLRGVCSLR